MEFKTFKMTEFKALDEPGTFTGYAAVFNNRDLGGDVILPGAFTKTLKDKGGKLPILDSHNPEKRIGIGMLSEDGKGLKVDKGILNLDNPDGARVYSDMKFWQSYDMKLGMSIGYDAIQKEIHTDKDKWTRDLKEVALWEFSPVTFGMNPKAGVTNVKDISSILEEDLDKESAINIIRALKSVLTVEEIKALLSDGAANEQANAPDTHAEVKLDVEFWRTLNKELKERMKNDRRN